MRVMQRVMARANWTIQYSMYPALTVLLASILWFASLCTGVAWTKTGNLDSQAAMVSHAVLVPAWMLLALYALGHLDAAVSEPWKRRTAQAALAAALLSGVGVVPVSGSGFSLVTALQAAGMFVADLVGLVVLVALLLQRRGQSRPGVNALACWTVIVSFAALSLATPLGHLAGAAQLFGGKLAFFRHHAAVLGLPPDHVMEGYVGSHSHQVIAAFLSVGFVMPLIRADLAAARWKNVVRTVGLVVVLLSSLAQMTLYQASAWFGWEPPTLFAHGQDGMPLDDVVLSILGVGLLLLTPALLGRTDDGEGHARTARLSGAARVTLLGTFLIAVVGVGVYIEFHGQHFGLGEAAGAVGAENTQAYIRAHLLFGCMIVPVLLGALAHVRRLNGRFLPGVILGGAMAIALLGMVGVLLWTFGLQAWAMMVAMVLTGVLLLALGASLLAAEMASVPQAAQ
jgi:hypothetical protein